VSTRVVRADGRQRVAWIAAGLVALLLLVISALARPAPALAACSTVRPPEDVVLFGDVVFVGTVQSVENGGRWATVHVDERWKGGRDVTGTIVVHGPEAGLGTVARTYAPGRYLFDVTEGDGTFNDDACSGTRPWADAMASLRPAGVQAADAASFDPLASIDPGDLAVVAALGVALLVAIVAYLYLLRSRRRPPDWRR
jgi:hypothetical protein